MKRSFFSIAFAMLLITAFPLTARAEALLIPGGEIIGLELSDDTVTVAAFDDVLGAAAREAGLRVGDRILKIDNMEIVCSEDVRNALNACDGDVSITVLRGSRKQTIQMEPERTDEGPRLGVYLRQGIAGIGTVTFYDPNTGRFGTLGHGVSDAQGKLLQMTKGHAYEASILSVKKGASGDPGQLRGNAEGRDSVGTLLKNTPQGVFGISKKSWEGEALPLAEYEEVTVGPASIRSTVNGNAAREYSVEILKIYPEDRSDCRNYLLRVTDPVLLESTGGIVQGMSGSPIIQNGKLVGAVTHVLVNSPDTGYGIFIENMLDAAA